MRFTPGSGDHLGATLVPSKAIPDPIAVIGGDDERVGLLGEDRAFHRGHREKTGKDAEDEVNELAAIARDGLHEIPRRPRPAARPQSAP
jgi:hypothetical protein